MTDIASTPGMQVESVESGFDLKRLQIPAICKDCDKPFEVTYRHFQPGVVSHCPHCRGSFVPTMPMFRVIHDAVEGFAATHQRNDQVPQREVERLRKMLEQLAHKMRPAGKVIRRKGLAAMFT